MLARVASREERNHRRQRPERGRQRAPEQNARRCESVDRGRYVAFVPVASHVIGAQRVDRDEQQVRGRCGLGAGQAHERGGEDARQRASNPTTHRVNRLQAGRGAQLIPGPAASSPLLGRAAGRVGGETVAQLLILRFEKES